jgi:hypothetical protein
MSTPNPKRPRNIAAAVWGVFGTALALAEAIFRLSAIAIRTLIHERLNLTQIAFLIAWMAFILYVEGYRAFQKRFSPRVVARAFHLAEHPKPIHVVLAPLYCMALLHATRRRLIGSWILVAGIVTIIILVRHLPPVYRAIIDAGVACALAWGTIVMIVCFFQRLGGAEMPVPPDVPEPAPAPRAT